MRTYPGSPAMPVDELGAVAVDCAQGQSCERQLLDAVCGRGGDVAWGMADNALGSTHRVAHAAHSARATRGPKQRGCAVATFRDAPPMRTENIGPVTAVCTQDQPQEVCLRELQDQTCLMGGDVLWQISGPTPQGDDVRMYGRAAHTR